MGVTKFAALASFVVAAACTTMAPVHNASPPVTPAPAPAPAATPGPTPAPAQAMTRFGGVVTAVTATQITATGADNAQLLITAAPDAWIVKGRPIQASEIHPGDFVATANVNNADGSGTSIELRVFPPGLRIGEGSYPMQEPNTTMTNATVAQVTNVSAGRQLTVTYGASAANNTPAGTRTITLPASVQVVQWYRVAFSDIHVGERVRGRGASVGGAIVAGFIFADQAPAPSAH